MEARNAAGYRVSLLNDDNTNFGKAHTLHRQQPLPLNFQSSTAHVISRPYLSPRSSASSPNTPELLRSDSYDSQMSNDPISPLTPSVDYTYPRAGFYGADLPSKRPAYVDSSRSTSYEDDSHHTAAPSSSERPGKRYPCRYRETHGCEKTFTTSGHASRHSKIHTAEKAVQCTYSGCQKKFTRADNMKQHLETHYKDKTRSSASQRAQKVALAEARRNSTGRSRSSTSVTTVGNAESSRDVMQWEPDTYAAPARPLPSPVASSWDMRTSNLPILHRPAAARAPNSGLDALAMAVACQENGTRC
ncbi:Zinc finger, C2H2-type/integrase, DNA-binding protein [Moelleriella libera RCEF 2490]|uniref:C2H2 type master regulator of conidiophore development brlA n=1 Tax=Moelleriella libera RCEF 2490 TaxID=1081109 RepID=A0A168B4P8_9HYPO|nr:Zinc finger, C2H2-type/integrase, DNA-binding protein [Moelleriella libera RCEF 2490]